MKCRAQQPCPLAYVAPWGWYLMPAQGIDQYGRVPVRDLQGPFEDIERVAVRAMCRQGKRLYWAYLDALAAVNEVSQEQMVTAIVAALVATAPPNRCR